MLQQLQPPFDLHLSSVSELGLEIFHDGVQLCISINLQSLLSSNLSFQIHGRWGKGPPGGVKIFTEICGCTLHTEGEGPSLLCAPLW